MKRLFHLLPIIFVLALVSTAHAQTYLSQQSHKQGDENAISVTSTGAQTGVDVVGYSSLVLTVSGTYAGVNFKVEGSTDSTSYTHTPLPVFRNSDGQRVAASGSLTNNTDQFYVDTRGFKKIRVNVTAYTSGTAIITQTPISAPFTQAVIAQNSTASNLKVDPSGVTSPISAASLPLPTGAATSTKQSDGSQKTQVVDGSGNVVGSTGNAIDVNIKSGSIASGSNVIGHVISDSGSTTGVTQGTASNLNAQVQGPAASGATKSGNPLQIGGVFNTTQPTVTNGQVVEAQSTARGAQIVATGVDAFNVVVNAALPTGSNIIGALSANQSVNVNQIGGNAVDTNSGSKSSGTQRVVIATDQPQLTNALKVDGSAVTQPVSGTVTANAGSGTFGSRPTDGTNAVTKTFDNDSGAGTEYNLGVSLRKSASGGSVEMGTSSDPVRTDPTGTTTQPVSGTVTANAGSGTFNIQSNASVNPTQIGGNSIDTNSGNKSAGTQRVVLATDQPQLTNALKVDGSAVTQPISASSLPLPTGAASESTVSSLNGKINSEITTDYDTGAGTQTMKLFGVALPASGGAVAGGTPTNPLRTDPTGTTTQPVSGTVTANAGSGTFNIQSNASVNHTQIGGTTVDTNSGNKSAGTQRVVLATDQPQLTNALKVDGSAVTQPISGTVTSNQGGSWTIQPGNTQNTTAWLVTLVPTTSGGLTISRTISAGSTNATSVKASAGQIYSIYVINTNAAVRYLKIYNKASAPTVGSDTPVLTLPISGATTGDGFSFSTPIGIAFSIGIAFAITTGVGDADTGAVAANEIVVNIFYK